jgi:hypothetical protein
MQEHLLDFFQVSLTLQLTYQSGSSTADAVQQLSSPGDGFVTFVSYLPVKLLTPQCTPHSVFLSVCGVVSTISVLDHVFLRTTDLGTKITTPQSVGHMKAMVQGAEMTLDMVTHI